MNNVLMWLRRNADSVEIAEPNYFVGVYGGRKVRYLNNERLQNRVEIGDGDFDRWANSVGVIFTIDPSKSIMLQMNKALVKAKSLTEYCTYLEIEV